MLIRFAAATRYDRTKTKKSAKSCEDGAIRTLAPKDRGVSIETLTRRIRPLSHVSLDVELSLITNIFFKHSSKLWRRWFPLSAYYTHLHLFVIEPRQTIRNPLQLFATVWISVLPAPVSACFLVPGRRGLEERVRRCAHLLVKRWLSVATVYRPFLNFNTAYDWDVNANPSFRMLPPTASPQPV